tara:strand:- start:1137 stop:1472 length:336 start_codon:yes stop_codon:yes gene_type:complete
LIVVLEVEELKNIGLWLMSSLGTALADLDAPDGLLDLNPVDDLTALLEYHLGLSVDLSPELLDLYDNGLAEEFNVFTNQRGIRNLLKAVTHVTCGGQFDTLEIYINTGVTL